MDQEAVDQSMSASGGENTPPVGASRVGSGYAERRVNLVVVANAQRVTLLIVAGQCLWFAALIALFAIDWWTPVRGPMSIAGWGSNLLLAASTMWWNLTMRLPVAMVIIGGLLAIIPFWNLIFVGVLNADTRDMLRRVGARPRLLGLNAAGRLQLRHGICGGCGYSLHGLSSAVCPECGMTIKRAMD